MEQKLQQAKSHVLAGKTYEAAAKLSGYGSKIDLYNALNNDPDIVAARADGTLKTRTKPAKRSDHYSSKPHVRAVMAGMSQSDAAKKFGVSQPLVSRHVRLAEQEAPTTATSAATPTSTPTPQPTPPVPPTSDLDFLVDIVRSYATRTGQRPEAVAYQLMHRLAD